MSAPDVSNITAEALSKLSGLTTATLAPTKTSSAASAERAPDSGGPDLETLLAQAAEMGAQSVLSKISQANVAQAEFEKRSSDIREGVFGIIERAQKVSTLKTLAEVGALNPEDEGHAAIIAQLPALEKASMEEQEELAGAVVAGDQADAGLQAGLLEAAATDPEMASEYAETLGDEVTPEDVDAIADLIIEEAAAQEGGPAAAAEGGTPFGAAGDDGGGEEKIAADKLAFEKRAAYRAGVFAKVSELNERTQQLLLRRADYRLAEYQAQAAAAE